MPKVKNEKEGQQMSLSASAEKEEGAANQQAGPKPGPVVAAGQQLPPVRPPKPADAASFNIIDVKELSRQRLRAGAGAFPFNQYGRASTEEAKDSLARPEQPGISQPWPASVVEDGKVDGGLPAGE